MINGSAKRFLSAAREIRQGDLLSRFLFPLVANAFSQILKNSVKNNLIQGFQVGKKSIPISQLQHADDTLLFLDGCKNNLVNLISLIHCFKLVLGMKLIGKRVALRV